MSARCLPALAASALALAALVALLSVPAHAGPARLASGGPSVQAMIVGTGGAVLSGPRTVTASATSVRVGGRGCAIASGTPLAVLAAMRGAGGPGYALRDYGRCGSSPVDSAQLFVYSLGGERNQGQSGWEYKVDHVAGSTGAADPSGARGDGRRIRSGAHVLWFWCNASGGGCQRTLDLRSSSVSVSRGQRFGVTISGYDNEGRGAPAAGAIATIGSDFASAGPHGEATLIAPSSPGRYALSASRRGLVPSFPETIVVR
ncbi:MAG TPA: hypothetical protein VHY83_04510 [Solirubrobacteraceae bacterium]|jgi:hypothetical protein|nr:hypothetical protein [Solirubrobacteraceae bacterium]